MGEAVQISFDDLKIKKEKKTQKERILEYIRQIGYITSWDAYQELGITQLGARIFELKQEGIWFDEKTIYTKNKLNESTHYTEYRLLSHIPIIEEM